MSPVRVCLKQDWSWSLVTFWAKPWRKPTQLRGPPLHPTWHHFTMPCGWHTIQILYAKRGGHITWYTPFFPPPYQAIFQTWVAGQGRSKGVKVWRIQIPCFKPPIKLSSQTTWTTLEGIARSIGAFTSHSPYHALYQRWKHNQGKEEDTSLAPSLTSSHIHGRPRRKNFWIFGRPIKKRFVIFIWNLNGVLRCL